MKISKLQKFAWVFFALAIGTTTLSAQGWRSGNRNLDQSNRNYFCLDVIPGLTEEQISSITELEEKHQEKMTEFRTNRRSITDSEEKDVIRTEMLEDVLAHRTAVKELLTEEQQKEYDLLLLQGNMHRNRIVANQRGNRNIQGRGQANWKSNRGDSFGAGHQNRSNRMRGFRGQGGYYRN